MFVEKAARALAGLSERRPEPDPVKSGPRGVSVVICWSLRG